MVGINTAVLNLKRKKDNVKTLIERLRIKYSGKKIVLGRDKLDPTKGVYQKLCAFELFLKNYTESRGKVFFEFIYLFIYL